MRLRSTTLSIWPEAITHYRVKQNKGEQFQCLVDGSVTFKLLSPTFAQNCYQGVFEDLCEHDLPEDISFFVDDKEKYPLLIEVKDYIQTTELKKGDCVYIPNFWFSQATSTKGDAILLAFTYESSSKMAELFYDAISEGILEKSSEPLINFQDIELPDIKGIIGVP